MIVIGLTGATGAGKGVFGKVAKEKYGFVHIDTDKTARSVVEPGKPCLCDICEFFGEDVINADGTLNRKKLGSIVFTDAEKLKKLNELTHHYITDEVNEIIAEAEKNGEDAVIIDAPLLFESGEDRLCDVTVGVIADECTRKKRIMSRDGISEEMADNRIASGKCADFFKEKCDYILENNGSAEDFEEKICRLIGTLTENKSEEK